MKRWLGLKMKIIVGVNDDFEQGTSCKPHVIVYGAGKCLINHYKFLNENYFVEAIVDKNKRGQFGDVPIYGLEYLDSRTTQNIIIMIENRDICMNIANMLNSTYGIPRANSVLGVNLVNYSDEGNCFKVGIMGCGGMASYMAIAILNMHQNIKVQACASRNQKKADEFAFKHGIEKAYGSYIDMLKDDEVDLIYIATPISEHYVNMKQCIEYRKNILCEKSFTINEVQAKEIFMLARDYSVYVAEAMTIRYHPIYTILKDILHNGTIGEVLSVYASFNYKVDSLERIRNIDLGGGALYELGVYNLNFMVSCLGYDIANIIAQCDKFEIGADVYLMLIIQYKSGKTAELYCDTRCSGNNQGIVYGEKGYVVIDEINNPVKLSVYDNEKRLVAEYTSETKEPGLENEMMVAKKSIEEKRIECFECSHEHTINIMKIMDKIRNQIEIFCIGDYK